jgi:hypothetical protein
MAGPLTAEQMAKIAKKDSDAVAEVACLYHEMNAVVRSLDEIVDSHDNGMVDRAKGLTMALDRLIQEVGRQTGARDR